MNEHRRFLLMVVNDPGFFISHRLSLANAAREEGFKVEIATARTDKFESLESAGYTVHEIPFGRKDTNPIKELKTILLLYQLYKKLQPDIVHHITVKPIIYGSFIARLLNLPMVVNAVTGLGYIFSKKTFSTVLFRRMIKYAYLQAIHYKYSHTIFQNPDDSDELIGPHSNERTYLIRGAGVDPDYFTAVKEPDFEPIVIALASRLLWSKGIDDFVKVSKALKEKGVDYRFVLIGAVDPGNPESVPEETLKEWDSENIIEWWGYQSDMRDVFSKVNIITLPTRYREGVPKVLIEAASAKKPIIATDMPGCREIVIHNKNGLLFPMGDVEAFSLAIMKLGNDKSMREEMGAYGRKMVIESFSLHHVIEETFKIYNKARGHLLDQK